MSNTITVFVAFFGWVVAAYIAFWTIKRSEISRLKDKVHDNADRLILFIDSQGDHFDPDAIEEIYNGYVTHLELRVQQFERYAGFSLAESSDIKKLRDVDFYKSRSDVFSDVSGVCLDFIEAVEQRYKFCFYDGSRVNFFSYLFSRFFLGAYFSSIVILLFYSIGYLFFL